MTIGFGRRSFILGASVAGERHSIFGKASMVMRLRHWESPEYKLSPVPSGAFCFAPLLRNQFANTSFESRPRLVGVPALIDRGLPGSTLSPAHE